jgi:DNA-binding transcriptional LysR family regulator
MDSTNLGVFREVARAGSMNRAAGVLHTVQSNVTRQVRKLEGELGTPLFNRHSRGVDLTDAGDRLLPYADGIAHMLEDADRAVRDEGEPVGTLVVGSLETTAALRLPPILASYALAHPGVDVTLATNTTAGLVSQVLAHELQGAFVCGPIAHPELEEREVFAEHLVLATAPRIRSLSQLTDDKNLRIVVFRAGCSYRQRLEAFLAGRGINAQRTLEFGTVDGILGCVAAGIGITLLPRSVVRAAAAAGRVAVHELPPEEANVATVFVRRKDRFLSSALMAFLATAQAHYSDHTTDLTLVASRET